MNDRGFGTYEDLENGFTREGEVARDYKDAGRDPHLPRPSPKDIQKAVDQLLDKESK